MAGNGGNGNGTILKTVMGSLIVAAITGIAIWFFNLNTTSNHHETQINLLIDRMAGIQKTLEKIDRRESQLTDHINEAIKQITMIQTQLSERHRYDNHGTQRQRFTPDRY